MRLLQSNFNPVLNEAKIRDSGPEMKALVSVIPEGP